MTSKVKATVLPRAQGKTMATDENTSAMRALIGIVDKSPTLAPTIERGLSEGHTPFELYCAVREGVENASLNAEGFSTGMEYVSKFVKDWVAKRKDGANALIAKSAAQFRFYQSQHETKAIDADGIDDQRAAEAREKAHVNQQLAEELEAYLGLKGDADVG